MKSFPLVFSLIVLCQTDMFGQVNNAEKNKITMEKSESSYWKENVEDFQKVNLLYAVLNHCNQDNVNNNKNTWEQIVIEYNHYLIMKNNLSNEEVAKTIAVAEYAVDKKFGSNIPKNICDEALEKSTDLKRWWDNKDKELR